MDLLTEDLNQMKLDVEGNNLKMDGKNNEKGGGKNDQAVDLDFSFEQYFKS